MERYGISRIMVEATLNSPERTAPDPRPGIQRSWRRFPEPGGRVLRVHIDVLVLVLIRPWGKAMKARATYDPEADAIGIYYGSDDATYEGSEEVLPGPSTSTATAGLSGSSLSVSGSSLRNGSWRLWSPTSRTESARSD